MQPQPFLDETSFHMKIETIAREKRMDHLDAILYYCKENYIDVEDIKKLLTVNLKDKVRTAAMDQGLMKRQPTLPL